MSDVIFIKTANQNCCKCFSLISQQITGVSIIFQTGHLDWFIKMYEFQWVIVFFYHIVSFDVDGALMFAQALRISFSPIGWS